MTHVKRKLFTEVLLPDVPDGECEHPHVGQLERRAAHLVLVVVPAAGPQTSQWMSFSPSLPLTNSFRFQDKSVKLRIPAMMFDWLPVVVVTEDGAAALPVEVGRRVGGDVAGEDEGVAQAGVVSPQQGGDPHFRRVLWEQYQLGVVFLPTALPRNFLTEHLHFQLVQWQHY